MNLSTDQLNLALTLAKTSLIAIVGLMSIYIIRKVTQRQLLKVYPDALRINVLVRLISYALLFLLATVLLQQFGINMTALIGAAGVVGVAIGFAAQTSVANIISGLFLTFEHPFELNDIVTINNIDGKVKALDLFAVTICTFDNKIVRISNEQVLKGTIINISKNKERRFGMTIDIAPNSDVAQAIAIIERIAKDRSYLVACKAPYIAVPEINGYYTRLSVGVWTTQKEWGTARKQFLPDLKAAFNEQNIALATQPVLTLPS